MVEETPPIENTPEPAEQTNPVEENVASPTFKEKAWAVTKKYWWVPAIVLPGGFIAIGIAVAKHIAKKK